jgi:RND family efflux transporter MFP subunit
LLLPLLSAACGKSEAPPPPVVQDGPTPVRIVVVRAHDLSAPVEATGLVVARDEVVLGFKVPGLVATISAESGMRVRAGAVLATLVPTEVDAVVSKATQAVERARREAERARRLARDSVIPKATLEDADTQLALAEADLRVAQFNAGYAEIRAPQAGTVLRRVSAPGALVAPGVPVVMFRPDGKGMVLRAGLADRDASRVRAGDRAVVSFDAVPDRTYQGRVERVSAMANAANGTIDVDIALSGNAASLATGLVGRARIGTGRQRSQLAIPLGALLEADGDSARVFTIDKDGDIAKVRRIRIGAPRADLIPVLGGLVEGERVIVSGTAYVTDGGRVRITPSDGSTPKSP